MVAIGALCGIATGASAVSDDTAVSLPGSPLTVYVGPRGQCQSSYTVNGKVEGNYFPGGEPFTFSPVGDCGFFLAFPTAGSGQPLALQGATFGFDGHAGPSGLTSYTRRTQSPVIGDGSAGNPFSQTTVFEVVDAAKAKDALITETTTYVNGAPQFTSTYNVKNLAAGKIYFRAMYAGDVFVNGEDRGTGVFLSGPPRFIGGQNTSSGVLGGLQELGSPALGWSAFEELPYPDVWDRVSESAELSSAFKERIEAREVNNAVGVEWDQFRAGQGLPSGAEQAFSIVNRTQVPSALGVQPLTQTHTVGGTATVTVSATDDIGTPYASRNLVYSIGTSNPKSGSVTTNASGVATISYVGTATGRDTMQMFLDLAGSGVPSPQDPSAAAQITWLPAPPAPNSRYWVRSIHADAHGTITIVFVPAQDGTATLEVTVPTATVSSNAVAARKKKCKRDQVKIRGRCRPKTTVSAKNAASGKAGVPLKLTAKASSKVKRALSQGRTLQLRAKLTYRSKLGGTPTVRSFHVKVKGKKKRHPR